MELGVEEFLEGLLSPQAHEEPSDEGKGSELVLELPAWYDEHKFKLGQKFYWDNVFACMTSMLTGLLTIMAVPSILGVLVHTRRSSSVYTAYKRYLATILHVVAWHTHPLAPGSVTWRSLYAVRSRHLRAGHSAKSAGLTHVSQRDLALTQFGFLGFTMTKADKLGIEATDEGWEGLNHFWRTVGHMIGIKDKYNICRADAHQTRAVCRALRARVFAPCLESAPEPFEHMAYVLLDGVWAVNPNIEVRSMMYFTRHLAEVPGYVWTAPERAALRKRLEAALDEMPGATAVESHRIVGRPAVEGPPRASKLYRPEDFLHQATVPEYKKLSLYARYKLNMLMFAHQVLYKTRYGRMFLNWNMRFSFWLMEHCPFLAFPQFGVWRSFVDLFVEAPTDGAVPKSNEESLKEQAEGSWYSFMFPFELNWW